MALTSTPSTFDSSPWDRQGSESATAYFAFAFYRDASEDRQLKATADATGHGYSQIRKWAARWNWAERTLAFDHYMQRLDLVERRRANQEARRRHARLANQALEKIAERLQTMSADDLSTEQIIKWLDIATRVESKALELAPADAPTAAIDLDINIDARSLIVAPRAELAAYLDKHPERIPDIIPVVQKLLAEGTEVLREGEKNVTPSEEP